MLTDDNPYHGLVEADPDSRWAFGAGFDDPLAGVDASVPPGVDGRALGAYSLALGDDALVLAQRLAQWCTRAPELEEEVALANIGLDLLGQTRFLYARAAAADPGCVPELPAGSPVPAEDRLAFFREPHEFRCGTLPLLADTDFAVAVVRLSAFSAQRLSLMERLAGSVDPVLSALARKAVKELRYHRDYAARWVLTLAGGTEESRERTVAALAAVWPVAWPAAWGAAWGVAGHRGLVGAGVAPDPSEVLGDARRWVGRLLEEAALVPPAGGAVPDRGGLLVPLLAELQGVARAHPRGRW